MTTPTHDYQLSQLDVLESEAIFIMREVVAEFERPVLLFSGGKDSIVMLRLAEKAFHPARIPFAVMHVDTGHNFDEVLAFRDKRAAQLRVQLLVASVQEAMDSGPVVRSSTPPATACRRWCCSMPSRSTASTRSSVVRGATRRRPAAKERIFSFRDEFGQWDPKNQRPELWNLYNGRIQKGESIRVFPLSNWTELDIWHYIEREEIELPGDLLRPRREVLTATGCCSPCTDEAAEAEREGLHRPGALPHRR